MNALSRREVNRPVFGRMFSDFFDDPFFRGLPVAFTQNGDETTLELDVSEDDNDIILRASLPGFRRDEIDVEINDGVVTIKATREENTEETTEKFYRRERRFGTLSRRVVLPTTVAEDNAQGELKDGVLTLRLPKAPEAKTRKVNIN